MKRGMGLVLALAVVFSLALTGCAGGKDKASPAKMGGQEKGKPGGVVSLRIWAEQNNFSTLEKMIDSFKERYAGEAKFDIVLEENSDASTRGNVLADVHGAADVFPVPDDQVTVLAAAGALDPVRNQEQIQDANLEEANEAGTIDGTLYVYPMTADNGYFMYYNKKYFSEKDVKTLDGMLRVAEKAHKKINMEWTSGWYMYAFFGNTGLDFGINEDGVTNHCNWNAKKGKIKGVDVARALLRISASSGFQNSPDGNFVADARAGKAIAGVSGAWNAMDIKTIWGDDYGAVKLPTYTVAGKQVQMASFKGYKAMGVNYYSKNKEWAHKLADWLTNEENQNLRFVERNQGPSNIRAAESEEVQKVPAIRAVMEQSKYGSLQRVGNNFWTPFESFGKAMADGNPEKEDLQKIMDALVKGITASTVN